MAFRKERTIYQNKNTRIFINQCHNEGKKTNLYVVRRDDKKGLGHYLGTISFDGGWRQFVFFPEFDTKWSYGCKRALSDFEEEITKKWRKSLISKRLKNSEVANVNPKFKRTQYNSNFSIPKFRVNPDLINILAERKLRRRKK